MLDKTKALSVEKQPRKSDGPRTVYIFKCKEDECEETIKVRAGKELQYRTGYCYIHASQKRPFESIYSGIVNSWRGTPVDLTYEQFVEFTSIKNCFYCTKIINWEEYGVVKGKYTSRAYYLDRKDNTKSYSIENCVVCCTRCNKSRSNSFTYEEWYGMTEYFRKSK